MASRRFAALLLIAGLFGSAPSLALEAPRDTSDSVSKSQAAVAATSIAAQPVVVRGLELQRAVFVVAAPPLLLAPSLRAPVTPVVPDAFGARPDVVTCPSQGPPERR